jgi:hypothetical protein
LKFCINKLHGMQLVARRKLDHERRGCEGRLWTDPAPVIGFDFFSLRQQKTVSQLDMLN